MKIDRRLLAYLICGFIIATVAGTLTHEFGHYIIARSLGYKAHISYAYTSHDTATGRDSFLITLGGPAQTMLTGTVAFVLLFIFRRPFSSMNSLSFKRWLLIFIALFWLRQVANFFVWLMGNLIGKNFEHAPDEINLSRYLNLPDWSIIFSSAILGAIILSVIIFKFIPIQQRLTFIISGMAGGVLGFIFWILLLGPVILP